MMVRNYCHIVKYNKLETEGLRIRINALRRISFLSQMVHYINSPEVNLRRILNTQLFEMNTFTCGFEEI